MNSMDAALRNGLWNAYAETFAESAEWLEYSVYADLYRALWRDFFKAPIDSLPKAGHKYRAEIRHWFFDASWHGVYDFIEFVARCSSDPQRKSFTGYCNSVLERELSPYRFANATLTPIASVTELSAVHDALVRTGHFGLGGVRQHLDTALQMLSDRAAPDYRNSVKESISAVEAIARLLSGDPKAEIGKALRVLEARVELHGAMKAGFSSLYGYTSDEGGIRHAMLNHSSVDFEDAKFMLVSCSAFVTFLVGKAIKAGVPLQATSPT